MNPNQKVATLFLFLGPQLTSELIKLMPPDAARRVLTALSGTAQVGEDDVQKVISEFLPLLKNASKTSFDQNAAHKILEAARGAVGNASWFPQDEHEAVVEAIQDELSAIADESLSAWLANERPPTIALALSLMAPQSGSAMLKKLPSGMHVDVCIQIANLKQAETAALDALLEVLKELRKKTSASGKSISGKKVLSAMLQSAGADLRSQLLSKLEDSSPELAAMLKKDMMTIERLATLSVSDLGRLCALVSDKELSYICKNESDETAQKLQAALSSNRKKTIQDEIACVQAIKKTDLEIMREKFIAAANKLHQDGKIIFPWEDEMV